MTAGLDAIRSTLADRAAAGFVHAGPPTDPQIRYLLGSVTADAPAAFADDADLSAAVDDAGWPVGDGAAHPAARDPTSPGIRTFAADASVLDGREHSPVAVAVLDDDVLVEAGAGNDHPAARLANRLTTRTADAATLFSPAAIPHDAALYVERAGFDLASSDAIERARRRKRDDEVRRIEAAQWAAGAGVRRAGAILADADPVDDHLRYEGAPLTPGRLRREVDAAIAAAECNPAGATAVVTDCDPDSGLRPGDPLVLRLAPEEPTGYRGALTRTLVPGTDGGWERRAHVAVESALRSAKTMLAADTATVREVERELVAEIGSFGFVRDATATVAGVGLEVGERPVRAGSDVSAGVVVALEAGVPSPDGGAVILGDLLAIDDAGAEWLARPSRALDPDALGE